MKTKIVEAYELTRKGFSSDRVLADPDLRYSFFEKCQQLGVCEPFDNIARKLLNYRKRGYLAGLKAKRTSFDDHEYRFAVEIAVRHLERRLQVTLDDVLCSEGLLMQFDSICCDLCPGIPLVQYRIAALGLRKSRSIVPEILSHAIPASHVRLVRVCDVKINEVPDNNGLYIFLAKDECLYVGEASNLRSRIKKHLDHSDNKRLARYLWEQGNHELMLELHVLDINVTTKVRRALEVELIRSRRPAFNILGSLAADG